jgi:hypothetical protein
VVFVGDFLQFIAYAQSKPVTLQSAVLLSRQIDPYFR